MADDVHATVTQQLRRTRQRYTARRHLLVDLLAAAGRPVSIPELLGDGADQSQSSLYRNLAVLEQCGVVRRLAAPDEVARFELHEDLTGHHHHVVCRDCGAMEDLTLPTSVERALDRAGDDATGSTGFTVESHRVELVGTCADCS